MKDNNESDDLTLSFAIGVLISMFITLAIVCGILDYHIEKYHTEKCECAQGE